MSGQSGHPFVKEEINIYFDIESSSTVIIPNFFWKKYVFYNGMSVITINNLVKEMLRLQKW